MKRKCECRDKVTVYREPLLHAVCASVIDVAECMESRSSSVGRARHYLPDIEEGGAVPTVLSDTSGSHVRRRESEVWVVRDDGRKNV
jgi:hypothetical protein